MGLISSIMQNQKKVDWFSQLIDKRKKELIDKYTPGKSIEDRTLTYADVYYIHDQEERRLHDKRRIE